MAEFSGIDLKNAREEAGLRQWQVAHLLHISESCIRRWENDEAEPTPDVVDKLEELYKLPMLWHRWMLSHSDSYRRHYADVPETNTTGSVLRNRYAIDDIMRIQDSIERDVAEDGVIDNLMNRDRYIEALKKAVACLTDTLARIERRGGAK